MMRPALLSRAATLALLLTTYAAEARAQVVAPLGGEPAICLTQPTAEPCRVVRVEAIILEGLGSTARNVVTRELLFDEGEITSIARIEESMARLRNIGIFREANYQLISRTLPTIEGDDARRGAQRAPSRIVRILLDERWTLLPAFRFAQGGELSSLTVALYDINVAGRAIEIGAQFERLGFSENFFNSDGNAANSYVAWTRLPRFLDSFWYLGADVWSAKRIRPLLDGPSGEVEGGFLLDRLLIRLRAEYEVERYFWAGVGLDYMGDDFSEEFLSQQSIDAQRANFGGLPEAGRAVRLTTFARIGRIDTDDFYQQGWRVSGTMSHSDPAWGAEFRFTQINTEALWLKRLPWRSNLALRASVNLGNAQQIQHLYYIGGLSEVRGYADSRFRGQNAWFANAEYRVAALAHPWIVLQAVGFTDIAGVNDDPTALLSTMSAASAGLGVRIIAPKIYRLVMRFDYAFPIIARDNTIGFSFGAQQFF
jgi:hypothetical protein